MNVKDLTKLVITSYADAKFMKNNGEFVTLVNPETYSEGFEIKYNDEEPLGASAAELRYESTKPAVFRFTFLFDATGVIPTSSGSPSPIVDQVNGFKAVTLMFDGGIHSPRWVKLVWGTAMIKGRLVSLDIEYTLFALDGTPLRARAQAQFDGSIETGQRTLGERTSSPDLTHVRVVKQGDTLPLLTRDIYGSSAHYLEVARFNGLLNFRHLRVGMQLKFPPLTP